MERPLVSIQCLVYNHGAYLKKCLDGIVMQKTTFKFEVIIHDDASADNSVSIIEEYVQRYPDIIKVILEKENRYSKCDGSLHKMMHEAALGKYIALCEGDDYWIDPLKLQKQIDFLEEHDECTFSCHCYNVYREDNQKLYSVQKEYFRLHPDATHFFFDRRYLFLKDFVAQTLTCVYRKDSLEISVCEKFKYYRDTHLFYFLLNKGIGVCHSFIGGVYRVNPYSIYGSKDCKERIKIGYNVYYEFYSIAKDPILKKVLEHQCYGLILSHQCSVLHWDFWVMKIWLKLPLFVLNRICIKIKNYGTKYITFNTMSCI